MMITSVTHLTRYVRNEDEALAFYRDVLGFEVHTDNMMDEKKRWLTVCTKEQKSFEVVLYNPHNWLEGEAQSIALAQIGHQPLMVLGSNDIEALNKKLEAQGFTIVHPIGNMPWGRDLTFKDLYGDQVYVVQPNS
jgi:catechol 2,3-dioxygenase-like lactoylglutathione lyase family enzyme